MYTMYKMKYIPFIRKEPPSMNLNILRYALEVEKSRSITGAAKQLFISQPNLSRDIRELEEEVASPFSPEAPRSGSNGQGKGIPAACQNGGAAVSGAGAFLLQRGAIQPLASDLRSRSGVYPRRLFLFSLQTGKGKKPFPRITGKPEPWTPSRRSVSAASPSPSSVFRTAVKRLSSPY